MNIPFGIRYLLIILAYLSSVLCKNNSKIDKLIVIKQTKNKYKKGTWLVSDKNLEVGFAGTDGWTVSGSYCAGSGNRGGYGCFGAGTKASRWFNIAHHWQVRITITFWMIDSWDSESLVVIIAGESIVRSRNLENGYNFCGASWNDEMRYVDETKQNHYARDILVEFSSTLDQDPNDESWGISDFTFYVEPCNPTCNQCQGQDAHQCLNCWANANFVPVSGSLGFCICKQGYYQISKDVPCKFAECSKCEQCHASCESCSDSNEYSCVKCQANLWKQYYGIIEVGGNLSHPYYQKTLCASNCLAANYYKDPIRRECIRCHDSCKTCNTKLEYECTSCYDGFYLDGVTSGQCVTTCIDSYYKDDTDKKCKPCNTNCLKCLDNQPNFCSKCKDQSYLTITTGICVSDCGLGQWEDKSEWKCKYCDSTCYNCDLNATNCTECTGLRYLYQNTCLTECPAGFYKGINNTCQQCDPSCKTCDQGTYQDCLSCSPSYGFLKDRECKKCPDHYYGDSVDQVCKICDPTCGNCDAGSNTDCVTCTSNYLEERQCKPSCKPGFWGNSGTNTCDLCDSNCLTCSPYGPNNSCLTCYSPLFLKNFQCIPSCEPIGEYGDEFTRECSLCDSTCYKCNQKNPTDCTECNGLKQFYLNQCLVECPSTPSYFGLNNKCIQTCPDKMYGDTLTRLCKDCNNSCPLCFGPSLSECNSCLSPYFLESTTCQYDCPSNKYKNTSNRKCTLCDTNCLECDGGSDSDCTKCDPNKYFGNKKCYVSCPAPYFSSTTTMECVTTCPKGYWGDENDPSRLCQVCHPQRCEECYGPTFSQCSKCKIGFYLFETSCDSCPIGYYKTDQRTCEKCHQTCRECDGPSSSSCLSCNDRYYLPSQKKCYDVCPSPYFSHYTLQNCTLVCPSSQLYGNTVTRRCEDCDPSCDECTGGTNLDCKRCASNYFAYDKDQSCLSKCPNSTYADTSNWKCMNCHKQCGTCKGDKQTDCLTCQLPNVLFEGQCFYTCPNGLFKDEDLKECVSDCSKRYPNKFNDTKEMKCKYCHSYCARCTGSTNKTCTKCKNPYLKYGTECLQTCNPDTYQDTKKDPNNINDDDCKPCHSDCLTCYNSSNSSCLTCSNNLFLLKNLDSTIQCLKDCPDQYIKNTSAKTCDSCPKTTYFSQGICKKCHQTCESCEGPYQNNCTKCVQTRGNSQNNPRNGVCECQSDYMETFKQECEKTPSAAEGVSTSAQVFAISGSTASSFIGILGRNMFFLYNIMEISQFTSYFRYINVNYPLNLDKLFDKLYISHISTFSSINNNQNNSNNNNSQATKRILEDTQFNDSNFLFELRGKNMPLWKSFFFLILLNILSWVFVGFLNILVKYWRIKYNRTHLIEKIRCWTAYNLPIQMFLRTSMEALLFIVLCCKNASIVDPFDWVICIYFIILLVATISIILYQNYKPIKLNNDNEPVIFIQKIKTQNNNYSNQKIMKIQNIKSTNDQPHTSYPIKKTRKVDEENNINNNSKEININNQKQLDSHETIIKEEYPHPYRTLWEFTKKDRLSRHFYLFYIIQKICLVAVMVQFVNSPQNQALAFGIIKSILCLTIIIIRPMISKTYNFITIFNEFLQALISFLVYACTQAAESSQNGLGYAIFIFIIILFLVNLIGTIIMLIFIIKNIIYSMIKKNKVQQITDYNPSKTDTLKPTRIQILNNKNSKQDQSYQNINQIDKSNIKNSDSFQKINDNTHDQTSKLDQLNNHLNEDEQTQSVNQSLYQHCFDNPFGFLDVQPSPDKSVRKNKKQHKKFANKKGASFNQNDKDQSNSNENQQLHNSEEEKNDLQHQQQQQQLQQQNQNNKNDIDLKNNEKQQNQEEKLNNEIILNNKNSNSNIIINNNSKLLLNENKSNDFSDENNSNSNNSNNLSNSMTPVQSNQIDHTPIQSPSIFLQNENGEDDFNNNNNYLLNNNNNNNINENNNNQNRNLILQSLQPVQFTNNTNINEQNKIQDEAQNKNINQNNNNKNDNNSNNDQDIISFLNNLTSKKVRQKKKVLRF